MATQIRIRNASKVFRAHGREVEALRDISFDVPAGQFACLLGPSGCGKSTLLNAVAGFSLPTSGSVEVDGRPVDGPGPDRGMVFQEYALFPWMTVDQNVAFGLSVRPRKTRPARAEIKEKVHGLLKLVAIGTLADMVPLNGENTLLVKRGLKALAGANGPGLTHLFKAARIEGLVLTASENGYGKLTPLDPPQQAAEEALALFTTEALREMSLPTERSWEEGADPHGAFVLAMVRWKQGRKEDARRLYDKGVKWMDQQRELIL